ncbi:MAG: dihydroorotate dehydrogenase electron transfer subunit [Thermodesulfovibrionales bacterium]
MRRHFKAVISRNTALTPHHNLLTLALPDDAQVPSPGQFYMVEVHKGNDPLLKRAFSLFRKTDRSVQILFRVQGRGTAILREMPEASSLDLLGPLGTFYPLPSSEKTAVVIAGGIGIASVFSLVEEIGRQAVVFIGARTADELFALQDLQGLARAVTVCTDDGSAGVKGLVTAAADRFLATIDPRRCCIYACGPMPMLSEVARIAEQRKIAAYVSLEEHMACGIGACLGCVVKVKPRDFAADESSVYQRVCKEGPVFDSRDIAW